MYEYYGIPMPDIAVTAVPSSGFDLAGWVDAGRRADHPARRRRPDRPGRPHVHRAAHARSHGGLGVPVRRARRHAVHRGRAVRRRADRLGSMPMRWPRRCGGCAALDARIVHAGHERSFDGAELRATADDMDSAARRLTAPSRAVAMPVPAPGASRPIPGQSAEAVGPKRSPASRAGDTLVGWWRPRAGEVSLDYHISGIGPGLANLEWKNDGSRGRARRADAAGILAAMAERIAVLPDRIVDTVRGEVVAGSRGPGRGRSRSSTSSRRADVPDGPRRIELAGHTLLPGLLDMHSHLAGEEETGQGYASLVMRSGAQDAIVGVRNARLVLEAGFTTVRDVGSFRAFTDVAIREGIEEGWFPGPRMLCAGAYVTVPGGWRRHHRARGRRRCGPPGRAAVRRDGRCGPDARQRPADPRAGARTSSRCSPPARS